MNDPVLIKYFKSFEKIASESTILALEKSPDICDEYIKRLIKYYSISMEFTLHKELNQKKCLKIAKKLESSPEYIDLLENCLIHKFKEIDKIFKNYPKINKKMIKLMITLEKYISKKIEKLKKDGDKELMIPILLKKIKEAKEKIKKITKYSEKFESFLKKNRKELAELKKNNKKAYITFFAVRYPIGCFEL
jgi:hypothetical protein